MVLKYIDMVRKKGLGVVFITHNVRHALAVGDRFTVLNRGKTLREEVDLHLLVLDELPLIGDGRVAVAPRGWGPTSAA